MALRLIEGPTDLAVSLERVKQHLRIDDSDQDDLIELYLKAAIRQIDGPTYLGRALKPQTWELVLDRWPQEWELVLDRWHEERAIEIPLSPLIEVLSVTTTMSGDSPEEVIDSANYDVDTASDIGRVVPISSFAWPALHDEINAARIRFRAGYPDTADSPPESTVPENIQLALLLMVGDAFAFRESVLAGGSAAQVPMSVTVENLLRTHRVFR